jgi:hypothetical protein
MRIRRRGDRDARNRCRRRAQDRDRLGIVGALRPGNARQSICAGELGERDPIGKL